MWRFYQLVRGHKPLEIHYVKIKCRKSSKKRIAKAKTTWSQLIIDISQVFKIDGLPHLIGQRQLQIMFYFLFENLMKLCNFLSQFFWARTLGPGFVISHDVLQQLTLRQFLFESRVLERVQDFSLTLKTEVIWLLLLFFLGKIFIFSPFSLYNFT